MKTQKQTSMGQAALVLLALAAVLLAINAIVLQQSGWSADADESIWAQWVYYGTDPWGYYVYHHCENPMKDGQCRPVSAWRRDPILYA